MNELTFEEVQGAWTRGREHLLKGEVSSPGLPTPPRAPHFRAPRPKRAFFDPVEQANHPSSPETVQPMTLGDLKQLEQNSAVEKVPQKSTRVKSAPKAGGSVRSVSSMVDEARRAAKLRVAQSSHKYLGRMHEIGKRLSRLQARRPRHNVPDNFMPV